jgi:hypothetical protein
LPLSSGWLRPLISLISFAISADMLRENAGGGGAGRRDHQVFFASFACCSS